MSQPPQSFLINAYSASALPPSPGNKEACTAASMYWVTPLSSGWIFEAKGSHLLQLWELYWKTISKVPIPLLLEMTYLYQNKISYYSSHLHVFCSVNRSVSSGSGSNIVGIVHSDVTFISCPSQTQNVPALCSVQWSLIMLGRMKQGKDGKISKWILPYWTKYINACFIIIFQAISPLHFFSSLQETWNLSLYPILSHTAALPSIPPPLFLPFQENHSPLGPPVVCCLLWMIPPFPPFFFGEQTCSGLQMLNPFTIPLTSKRINVLLELLSPFTWQFILPQRSVALNEILPHSNKWHNFNWGQHFTWGIFP